MIRTYDELRQLPTFKERFDYLKLNGRVCEDTFGFDRYLNQVFYRSSEWKEFRDKIILRDEGCDLGIQGREIIGPIYVHHMNPMRIKDIESRLPDIMDERYVVCCSFDTHQAIHYGKDVGYGMEFAVRTLNDTAPWRRTK